MEGKSLKDVRALIHGNEFHQWCDAYKALRQQIEDAHSQYSDEMLHTVWRAGELEDRSAEAHAAYIELERSFDALSEYEIERQRATDLWMALQGAEKRLEDQRATASEIRAKLEARKKGRRMTSSPQEFQRRESEIRELDTEMEKTAKECASIRERFEAVAAVRDQHWASVEHQWTDSFRSNMARAEFSYLAKRVRSDADNLSAQLGERAPHDPTPEEEARDAELDRQITELEEKLAAAAVEAEQKFNCVLVREFLYWPRHNEITTAWCVPLITERDQLNLQVEALRVYEIERARGIEFIEPLPEEREDEEDPRLERFFLEGRAGISA